MRRDLAAFVILLGVLVAMWSYPRETRKPVDLAKVAQAQEVRVLQFQLEALEARVREMRHYLDGRTRL